MNDRIVRQTHGRHESCLALSERRNCHVKLVARRRKVCPQFGESLLHLCPKFLQVAIQLVALKALLRLTRLHAIQVRKNSVDQHCIKAIFNVRHVTILPTVDEIALITEVM